LGFHYGDEPPHDTFEQETLSVVNTALAADFHEYAVEWEPSEIRWYIDGVQK
jgi:beta-glucanase (GH16 family)